LTPEQKERLLRILTEGPMEAGYWTNLWTLKRIGKVSRRELGVQYTIPNIWKLMQNLGWSYQKPDKRAWERNEKAIRYWQQHVWQGQKHRRAWSPFGLA